ncbi:MAG TPA: hypothetical protein VFW18_04275 [Gaiellales bacterium]|nr:hypothetical protein [Gaiellales bacterium]
MNRTLRGVWLELRVIPVLESVAQCETAIIFSGIAGPPPEHAPA